MSFATRGSELKVPGDVAPHAAGTTAASRKLAFLLLLMLVPLLAACGSAETTRESVVGDSAVKTAQAGTSRVEISYAGKQVSTAAFDYRDQSGILEVDGDLQQIFTRDASYLALSALPGVQAKGKRWVKSERATDDRGLFMPFATSPTELLGFLKAASEVERIDTGKERGVEVTRYKAMLEFDRAAKELPKGERDFLRHLVRQYWTDGRKGGIPFELSIDGEGRLRRVSMTIPEDEGLVVEFYDYGVEVDAKPPPADEVVTWDELGKSIAEALTPEEPK